MKRDKDITVFDVETTGLDLIKDRVIQFSGIRYTKDLKEKKRIDYYIIPEGEWEITKDSYEVNGIDSDFLLEKGVNLKDVADEIIEFLTDCDLLVYNGLSFDIPFMVNEFKRIGKSLDITQNIIYDSFQIERVVNSNRLEAAYKRYTGKQEVEGAHNALNDSMMTMRVFYEQCKKYDIEDIIKENNIRTRFTFIDDILDLNSEGLIIFSKGKHKSESVYNVCRTDPSYIKWLFKEVLSDDSKNKITEEYNRLKSR